MDITALAANGKNIAVVHSNEVIIGDVQSALDLIATVRFETDSDYIVINKLLISENFFDLKTGLAGEVLQKFINYRVKVAIFGDFSEYSSRSLKDFMYECNRGNDLFFLPAEQDAIEKLSLLKQ